MRMRKACGVGMHRFGRWAVSGLVTAAAFALPTWICAVLVLPAVLKDPSIRWGLASALGTALAALAAAWGYGFATRVQGTAEDRKPPVAAVSAPGVRAVAIGGANAGGISTGDTAAPQQPSGQVAGVRPQDRRFPAAPAAGTVTASGERSIAIGGGNSGALSTGDQHGGAPS